MKKNIISVIVCAMFIFLAAAFTFATDEIVEVPHLKIIIDGKLTTYKDVPISVNQSNLLPLRECLVNLGVANDDQHIIWNGSEKSVTVYKDETKIYLKVGSNVAYVNDKPVTLDVAPVGYSKNQKIYIPIKFISQVLGKKVVWDGTSKAVLISEEKEFNEIKEILDKSDAAMKKIKKCKLVFDINAAVNQNNSAINFEMSAAAEVDQENKAMHMLLAMKMLGMDVEYDAYFDDNVMYVNNPLTGEWVKTPMTEEEYDKMFEQDSNTDILDANETVCAGLVMSGSGNPDEVLLKGDIFLNDLYDTAMNNAGKGEIAGGSGLSQYDIEKFHVEITLDKDSYLVKKIIMHVEGDIAMDVDVTYSDYDGSFKVSVPKDVKEKAVEEIY